MTMAPTAPTTGSASPARAPSAAGIGPVRTRSSHAHKGALAALALLADVPTSIALDWATHPGTLVQRALALRPDLPSVVQRRLLDAPRGVRALVMDRLTDPELVCELAVLDWGKLPRDRAGLAANPRTPAAVLDVLATQPFSGSVAVQARSALANPSTTADVVRARLAADKRTEVVGDRMDASRASWALRILAAHPSTGAVWANSSDTVVVRTVASRPDITLETATRIWGRRDRAGKDALARNPFVPTEVFGAKVPAARRLLEETLRGHDPLAWCASLDGMTCAVQACSPTLDALVADHLSTQARLRPLVPDLAAVAVLEEAIGRDGLQPDPVLLGRLVEAAGLAALPLIESELPVTRRTEAARFSTLLAFADQARVLGTPLPPAEEIETANRILGTDLEAWDTFARVTASSTVTLDQSALVASAVAEPAQVVEPAQVAAQPPRSQA